MKRFIASFFLSIIIINLAVANPEPTIDDIWADDSLLPNADSSDLISTYDVPPESIWDDNLVLDPEPYTAMLASVDDNGCSGNMEPLKKREKGLSCAPPINFRLSLPQSPYDVQEKTRVDLDPLRIPLGASTITKTNELYCGNQQFVICDSAREQDEWPNGNGKYRLQYVGLVLQGSICTSPHSIWCCEQYLPGWLNDQGLGGDGNGNGNGNGNGVQSEQAPWEVFGYSADADRLTDLAIQHGDVADQCSFFVTLP